MESLTGFIFHHLSLEIENTAPSHAAEGKEPNSNFERKQVQLAGVSRNSLGKAMPAKFGVVPTIAQSTKRRLETLHSEHTTLQGSHCRLKVLKAA